MGAYYDYSSDFAIIYVTKDQLEDYKQCYYSPIGYFQEIDPCLCDCQWYEEEENA